MRDAARFLQMHLRDGELDGTRILGVDSAVAMRQITTMGRRFDLGLGWFRPAKRRTQTPAFVQHRGDGGAFATDMRMYPEAGLGLVMRATPAAMTATRSPPSWRNDGADRKIGGRGGSRRRCAG